MNAGVIYYTDNRIEDHFIFLLVQKYILQSGLPIVSCSLKPIEFGENIVLEGRERSYPTMVEQIITALDASTADFIFFCEHDVLYHPSHFKFIPEREDIYYYNINNWRWFFGRKTAITYNELSSLSMLCANRKLALSHYKYRKELIEKWKLDEIRSREPRWARKFGYEPGTKKRRRGGVTDEEHEKWRSEYPNIDIRHKQTFSKPKVTLKDFKHPPTDWKEEPIGSIPGWNLGELFDL